MIVKNEAPIIASCLRQVIPLIDAWAIMDTGSTDGTVEIVQNELQGIPGRLGHMEWAGFAMSRNAAIDLANGLGDYLMFLDADDKATWSVPIEQLKNQLVSHLHHGTLVQGENRYNRLIFRNVDSASRYKGVIHEVLIPTKQDVVGLPIDGFVIERGAIGVGNRSNTGNLKYARDAELLEDALKRGLDPEFTERYRFYLAQSYRDHGELEKALENYKQRLEMPGGYQQERYVSALNIGFLLGKLGAPIDEQLLAYFKAREIDPARAEAHHRIAELARLENMWHLSFDHAQRARDINTPYDRLFVDLSIPRWRALFEISISAWYVNEMKIGREACEALLESPFTPVEIKILTNKNLNQYPR